MLLVVIVGALVLGGTFAVLIGRPFAIAPGAPAPAAIAAGCPEGKGDIQARMRNGLAISAQYIPATLDLVNGEGKALLTDTLAGGSASFELIADDIECPKEGAIWVRSDGTVAGTRTTFNLDRVVGRVDIEGANASKIEYRILSSTFANITASDDVEGFGSSTDKTFKTSSAQALGANEGKTFFLEMRTDKHGQFGPAGKINLQDGTVVASLLPEGATQPNQICADFPTSKFSQQNGVVISGLKETSVNALAASQNFDKCWELPVITSISLAVQYKLGIKADVADPGASDDVVFRAYDFGVFAGRDGLPHTGYHKEDLSVIGVDDTDVTIDIS